MCCRVFPKLTFMYVDGLPLDTPPVVNSTHIPHLWRAVVEFKNPSKTFERTKEYDICLNAEKYHTFGFVFQYSTIRDNPVTF